MANEKKYSAQEAAIAVLSKAQEMLGKSELFKAEKLKKDGSIQAGIAAAGGGGNMPINPGVVSSLGHAFGKGEYCEEHAKDRKDSHKVVQKSECMKCMGKSENKESPSNPMKPRIEEKPTERDHSDFETKPEGSNAPDHRQAEQKAPEANPKEQAEGNNPPAGSIPGNGIHKLMYFTGHMDAKKKMKKGIALS